MTKFPIDAPKARVIRALVALGFQLVREREHISMSKQEILTELPNLTRPELEQVDVRLQELLGHTGGKSPKLWGEALLEIAGTAQGLPADYAHNHDHYRLHILCCDERAEYRRSFDVRSSLCSSQFPDPDAPVNPSRIATR